MPYIKQKDREMMGRHVTNAMHLAQTPGELNYLITKIVLAYYNRSNTGDLGYSKIATVTGVLENVKQEFYRRLAAPYEDQKIQENGDVYG